MARYRNFAPARASRQDHAVQQTALDQQQQQIDAGQQNDWINQVAKLYGLSQARAEQPEHLRGMRLQNDAQQFENDWAQPNAEAKHAAMMGLADQRDAQAGKTQPMNPAMAQYLHGMKIISDQELADLVLPPEMRAARKATADAEAAKRAAAQAADAAQQGHGEPPPSSWTHNIVTQIPGMYEFEQLKQLHNNPQIGNILPSYQSNDQGSAGNTGMLLPWLMTLLQHPSNPLQRNAP